MVSVLDAGGATGVVVVVVVDWVALDCAKAGAATTDGPPGVVRPGRGACPTAEPMLLPI